MKLAPRSLVAAVLLFGSLAFSSVAYAQDPTPTPAPTQPAPTPTPAPTPAPAATVQLSEADLGEAIATLKKGENLGAMAKTKGVELDVLNAAVLAQIEAAGAQAVQAGKITQAQADERIAPFRKVLGKADEKPAEKPADKPMESKIKPAPPPPKAERKVTGAVIAAGVLSVTALASGIVFTLLAAGKHSEYTDKPDHKVAVEGERNVFVADVSFGLAGLFGLAAIGLYLLPDDPQPPPSGGAAPAATTKKRVPTWIGSAIRGEGFRF